MPNAIDDSLTSACRRALRCSREATRASIVHRTLAAGHEVFRAHLVPAAEGAASAAAARRSPSMARKAAAF